MLAGDGCWAPGIHWDAENSAAFTGPRAGAWPWTTPAGCTIANDNGLFQDPTSGVLMVAPPVGMNVFTQTWNQASTGASPAANTFASTAQHITVNGQPAVITLPNPTCPSSGAGPRIRTRAQLLLDVTVGTRSNFAVNLPTDSGAGQAPGFTVDNGANVAAPTITSVSNTGSLGGTGVVNNITTWSDEPYGILSLDQSGNPNGLTGSISVSGTSGTQPQQVYRAGCPSIDSGQPYTMAVWVKPTAYPSSGNFGRILFTSGTNAPLIYADISSTGGLRYLRAASDVASPAYDGWNNSGLSNVVPLNVWSLVLLFCDGTNVWYQVIPAGQTGSSTATKAITIGTYAGTHNWGVGGDSTQVTMTGYISNPYFFTRVLSSSDITGLMATPYAPPGASSSIHFRLNNAVARRRVVRSFLRPAFTTNFGVISAQWDVIFFPAGANKTVINAWSLTGSGFALSPTS